MKTVLIGIGIPGSGKTTCLKQLAENFGAGYVCPDDIRAELGSGQEDQSKNKEVWEEAFRRIPSLLAKADLVVVDATNADPLYRACLVEHCRKFADRVEGAWFITSLEECLARNSRRERKVPEEILTKKEDSLKTDPPNESEGFDRITIVVP